MSKKIYGVREKVPFAMFLPLSLQHTFAMFGASVLVPLLFGIDPSIVLFMNGIGTLLFIALTKGKAPAYLGSSFAFLGPAGIIIASMGFRYAQGAFVVVGLLGCLLAVAIRYFGIKWIDIVLPPAAMGAVVALIGFELAGLTVAGGLTGANIMVDNPTLPDIIVFLTTLSIAAIGSVAFKGFWSTIPILIGIVAGYTLSFFYGMIDFLPVQQAIQNGIFVLPNFQPPKFDINAILIMLPVLLVIISEHISHQIVTSNIIGKDLLKDPGLHRSILGDNLSTALSGMIGGVPTTTYGENIGVMAVTGVYSVYVIGGAAIISILMSFISPFAALIQTIPGNVIGGITFLLYGMIGASGIRLLVDQKIDYSNAKNLVLTSIVFTTGLSGLAIRFEESGIEFKGMVLASVVAIAVSLIFYILERIGIIKSDN